MRFPCCFFCLLSEGLEINEGKLEQEMADVLS